MEIAELISHKPKIVISTCSCCNQEITIEKQFITWGKFMFCNESCIKESYSENLHTYGIYKEAF